MSKLQWSDTFTSLSLFFFFLLWSHEEFYFTFCIYVVVLPETSKQALMCKTPQILIYDATCNCKRIIINNFLQAGMCFSFSVYM